MLSKIYKKRRNTHHKNNLYHRLCADQTWESALKVTLNTAWCMWLHGQITEACCCGCKTSASRVGGKLCVCLPAYLSAWPPSTVSRPIGARLDGGGSALCPPPPPLLSLSHDELPQAPFTSTASVTAALCWSSTTPASREREGGGGLGDVVKNERMGIWVNESGAKEGGYVKEKEKRAG